MASSLKVSELNSLNQLTDNDLFLVSDVESGTSRKVKFSTLKNDATSQLASTVAQNRQDAEQLVETVRTALQLAIDGNASYSTQTRSSLTTSNQELQQGIDNLRTYIDGKISSVLDSSPEALNTLNELAAALGDDPNYFINTNASIADVNTSLAAETTARTAAFTALQADVNTLLAAETTARTAAFTALQDDVDQNEVDANAAIAAEATARGVAIAAVQADVDQNEVDADAAIAALQANVDQNKVDANAAIAALQADVDQNEADADAAIAAETLARNNGVAVLNADIANVNASIAAETLARNNGDAVLATALADYKEYNDQINLELALAYDVPTYIENLQGG